jgi:TRAP-type uncharacterized transport system substrate-binding protein
VIGGFSWFLGLTGALLLVPPALAQQSDTASSVVRAARRAAAENGEQDRAARLNNWTVGVAGGLLEGTFIRFAAELAKALDDGDNLRVLPIVTFGAAGNVGDLLYLKGVDIAITDADVLAEVKKEGRLRSISKKINYISEMYVAEFHVFVRPEIKTLRDLDGKKVGFNTKGSAANLTGKIVFERLNINVQPVFVNNSIGIEQMKAGKLAGIVHAVGKPNGLFARLKPEPGFHFLPVKFGANFADYYMPSELTSEDYPNIIRQGESIETIGVPVLLAVYNWPKRSDRFRRVKRFIQYYFKRFDNLKKPPYHPKWKEINLSAKVPGWTRYWVADRQLKLRENTSASSKNAASADPLSTSADQ